MILSTGKKEVEKSTPIHRLTTFPYHIVAVVVHIVQYQIRQVAFQVL